MRKKGGMPPFFHLHLMLARNIAAILRFLSYEH